MATLKAKYDKHHYTIIYQHVMENTRVVLDRAFEEYLDRNGTDLQTFLLSVRSDIRRENPRLERKLFPNSNASTSSDNWELSTLCNVLKKFCNLGLNLERHLQTTIDMRNELCHMPRPQLAEKEYRNCNSTVKAVMRDFIQYIASTGFEKEINEMIRTTETEPFDAERFQRICDERKDLQKQLSRIGM